MVPAPRISPVVWLAFCIAAPPGLPAADELSSPIAFPAQRPVDGNFNRPRPGEVLDISPPGFCWWRAGPRDRVAYQLTIRNEAGELVHTSPILADPVHVPNRVLPPGSYHWQVAALAGTRPAATLGPRSFRIAEDPIPMPWTPPAALLARVPRAHPRLLFPAAQLDDIRASLATTRKAAFLELREIADQALTLKLMKKPTFDRFDRDTQYAQRRVAYRKAYREFSRTYNQGMLPLAAMYLLTGDERYGQAAKAHLLNILDWETDGIASLESGFDEIGLRIERSAAQGYDWLYDLLSPHERDAVQHMLIAHGDMMLSRLRERDFLNFAGYSHDGRLPGYLTEFAIAMAEHPSAERWLDYAMQALLTVFPHWAGADGGWAEGINYSLSYNDRFITPLESLYTATGYDLWQKPFFRKHRHFVLYNTSPHGEILPFGDGEQKTVASRADTLNSVLNFHALKYRDPVTKWWLELVPSERLDPVRPGALHRLILPDTVQSQLPTELPLDRVFDGVGWAALHTDISHPKKDLMVMFKSSPFGSVSHSHADQNSFVIMKGGKALAIPGGERYPQHGSPFHEHYTQHTVAHNALLIDGQGQRNRDGTARGRIVAFRSTPHVGYVAGDAHDCYQDSLQQYFRHVVLIRPSLIVILDELTAVRPIHATWLLHTKQKIELEEASEQFTVHRGKARMWGRLAAPDPLSFSQTDDWPIPPRQGYPMVTAPEPAPQWHFQAQTTRRRQSLRIAAVMLIGTRDHHPACTYETRPDGVLTATADLEDGNAIARINVADPILPRTPLIDITFVTESGESEHLAIPSQVAGN